MLVLLKGKHTQVNLVQLQGCIKGIDFSIRLAILSEILPGLFFFVCLVGWFG